MADTIISHEYDAIISHEYDWSPWVHIDLQWSCLTQEELGLLLTINFSKHHLKVLGGRIWFGLRGGELELEPTNATIPYKHRWPRSRLAVKIKTKRSIDTSNDPKQTQGVNTNFNFKTSLKETSAGIDYSHKKEIGQEKSIDMHDEFEHVIWQVYTKGSETKAYWNFEVASGNSCLQGSIVEKEICKLLIHAEPFNLKSKFMIFKKDIRLLNGEGLWPESLDKVKKTVIHALLRKTIMNKMGTVIQQIELQSPQLRIAS